MNRNNTKQINVTVRKAFTLLSVAFLANFGYSQNAPIDFETGGNGAAWTWTTFENGTNPALEVVANPSSTGANTSSKVAKFTTLQAGNPWAGVECKHADIGKFTLSASNAFVKIMVYKSVISDVGIKFATNSNASTGEIKVANTKINEWEELTFNFTPKIGEPSSTDIDQIIVFTDFNLAGRTSDNVSYFDNITFSSGPTIAAPTVAAPTPTKPAADVISLFSNAYTNKTVDIWRTGWSAATLTDMQVAGNDTKKYSSLDFVGIETVTSQIDLTTMDSFHVDMWTPNSTTFKVKLVDYGMDAANGGGDDKEHELSFTPALEKWVSLAIPLTNFTGLTTKKNFAQLIFASVPSGSSIVYVDNVFFSKKAPSKVNSKLNVYSLNVYPNPAKNTLNIQAKENIQNITILNSLGQIVFAISPNAKINNINISDFKSGLYTVKTEINGEVYNSKLVKN